MKRLLTFCAGILLTCMPAAAQSPACLLKDTVFEVLHTQLEVLEDTTNALDIGQVQQRVFQPMESLPFVRGYRHETIWLRFKVVNRAEYSKVFTVEVVNPLIPKLSFFQVNGRGQVDTAFSTGASFPFSHRPVHRRNFMFPLHLEKGDSCQVYLSIARDFLPNSNVLIVDYDTREGVIRRYEDILLTVFFVFCSLYLILSAFVFSVTRQRFQWYYFGYVLLTACFISAFLGHGFQYIWPEYPRLQFVVPLALNNVRLILGIWFFQAYFDLARNARRLNIFLGVTIGIFLMALLVQSIYTVWGPFSGIYASLMHAGYVFFCVYLFFFCLVIMLWALKEFFLKRRRRSAALFLVVILNFIGLATTSLQALGYNLTAWAPDNIFTKKLVFTTQTFYVPVPVMAAFFFEMLLVFNFSMQKFMRLLEKDRRTQMKIAQAREEGLQALILGVENERRRIARELHDGACVQLAAINMQIDHLRDSMDNQLGLSEQLASVTTDLEETYRELRSISHDLMSKALEKTDLRVALEDLVIRCRNAQPSLDIQFYAKFDPEKVDRLVKIHLYRIVQELMANVLKHAQATLTSVQVLEHQGLLLLTVEDNGIGFDTAADNPSDGIGLANIRTRVEVLRGTLHLESATGRGTFVNISIPWNVLTTGHAA